MTAPARISQADIDRAIKAAKKAGGARVSVDLVNQRIDIILSDGADSVPEPERKNPLDRVLEDRR